MPPRGKPKPTPKRTPKVSRSVTHVLGRDDQSAMVIDDPAVLKALFDPLRYRIVKVLDAPKPIRDIAAELDLPASRLYYHVDLLVRRGLVKVAEQRVVGTNVERLYARVANRFELTDALADSTIAKRTSATQMEESFADHLRRITAVADNDKPRVDGARERSVTVADMRLRMRPEKAEAFAAKVRKLIDELRDTAQDGDDAAEGYALLFVFSTDDEAGDRT